MIFPNFHPCSQFYPCCCRSKQQREPFAIRSRIKGNLRILNFGNLILRRTHQIKDFCLHEVYLLKYCLHLDVINFVQCFFEMSSQEDNILPVVLQMLKEECHKDNALIGEQTYQTALRTLLRILRFDGYLSLFPVFSSASAWLCPSVQPTSKAHRI